MPVAIPRDPAWLDGHRALVERAQRGGVDLYFIGDSITRRWEADHRESWDRHFGAYRPGDFGMGGDTTANVLYRIENGALDGAAPKVIVLMIGTNDIGFDPPVENAALVEAVSAGVVACVQALQARAPAAKVLLTGITARNTDGSTHPMRTVRAVNERLARFADGERVRFLDINDRLAEPDGALRPGVTIDGLHFSPLGYELWAEAMRPILREWFGR